MLLLCRYVGCDWYPDPWPRLTWVGGEDGAGRLLGLASFQHPSLHHNIITTNYNTSPLHCTLQRCMRPAACFLPTILSAGCPLLLDINRYIYFFQFPGLLTSLINDIQYYKCINNME